MVLVPNSKTFYRNDTSDVMPIYVPNETKCVIGDYIYGLPRNDVLNEMKEKILKVPSHEINYLGKAIQNNNTDITQRYEDEGRRDGEVSDLVKVTELKFTYSQKKKQHFFRTG